MALSSDTKIDTSTQSDRYDKYLHCDICNAVCISSPIYLSVNKDHYLYATAAMCPDCRKVFRVDFIYDTNIPNKIDDNDIRHRIRHHQMSMLNPPMHYELFELKLGRLCNPNPGETFEQFKERYRKTRDDFYKELENGERRENNNN